MLQTFSLNSLFNNAKSYLAPSSGTPLGSRSNSYESLKDASDISFSTPSSPPCPPGPDTWSPQTTFPPSAPPITTPTVTRPSLGILPFPPSQASLAPNPDPSTPSLLDTSISFARMMDRTGSPASFLTCSSGWDPGIVCGAVGFPSLLHSGQSVDNFHPTQEIYCSARDVHDGAECTPWETSSLRALQLPSKASFSAATPFYFPPSPRNGDCTRLQPSDLVTPALPRAAFGSRLPSPTISKYSASSPRTTSPGSEFSLEESMTSSLYHDPFHWDTVLADLPPSPQYSPMLPTAASEHPLLRISTPTSPVPSFVQCNEITIHSLARDSVCSTVNITGAIPTIVVLNPDSSIIGLYGGRCETTQALTRRMPTPDLQAPEAVPEIDFDEGDADVEASSPESEFEIVTVPTLKVRLDDISETDEIDAENAFGSLMTLGSIASGNPRIQTAEERTSTGFLDNGPSFLSSSSVAESCIDVTSAFPSWPIVQSNPKVISASTSFASTAKLYYAQSGTSISGQSTASSWNPTASGSESDCPWLFSVEDGKILEVPRSTSAHGGGKFADKLARFPNVPTSPQLTPLPSPFASPLPSPSLANRHFLYGSPLPQDILNKKPSGTATVDADEPGSLLSPYRERDSAECSTVFSRGIPISCQPTTAAGPSGVAEISFGELDLGLSSDFGSLVSCYLATHSSSSSSSGYSTKLSTAQSATLSYGRHVHFESGDFRPSNLGTGEKRHSPHHRRPPFVQSKTCLKKKRWSEKGRDRRGLLDAPAALVRSPGVDCDHLPSSFSSESISKKGSWWRRGRFLVTIGRVRRGIGGCLSLREVDTLGGSVAWATEHDYQSDHLVEGKSKRPGDQKQGGDGTELLQRIRTYS